MSRQRYIRASEIGEYMYCRRAWWLHHSEGLEPAGRERRDRGVALHVQHGRQVWTAQLLLLTSLVLIIVAVTMLALS